MTHAITDNIIDTFKCNVTARNACADILPLVTISDNTTVSLLNIVIDNDKLFDALSNASKSYVNVSLLRQLTRKLVEMTKVPAEEVPAVEYALFRALIDVYNIEIHNV